MFFEAWLHAGFWNGEKKMNYANKRCREFRRETTYLFMFSPYLIQNIEICDEKRKYEMNVFVFVAKSTQRKATCWDHGEVDPLSCSSFYFALIAVVAAYANAVKFTSNHKPSTKRHSIALCTHKLKMFIVFAYLNSKSNDFLPYSGEGGHDGSGNGVCRMICIIEDDDDKQGMPVSSLRFTLKITETRNVINHQNSIL